MQRITNEAHDFLQVNFSEDTTEFFSIIANIPPIACVLYRFIWKYEKNDFIKYITWLSIMYFIKAVVQTVTVIPRPTHEDCTNRTFFEMVWLGNCADMMFSGHTAIVYLTLYGTGVELFSAVVEGVLLVLGKDHYTSDIIVALIVSDWITRILPLPPKPSPSPPQRLQIIKNTELRW